MPSPRSETHPHLPSGEWEGFYCYHSSPAQHKMATELHFAAGVVTGVGTDDVASFVWEGKYDLDTGKLEMTKTYATHDVLYRGDIDENGIWGVWEIVYDYSKLPPGMEAIIKASLRDTLTGGFHIWPKPRATNANNNEREDEMISEKLREIYTEVFS